MVINDKRLSDILELEVELSDFKNHEETIDSDGSGINSDGIKEP